MCIIILCSDFLVGQSEDNNTTSQNFEELGWCNLLDCASSFLGRFSLLDSHNTIILPLGTVKKLVAVITLTVYHHSWNKKNIFEVLELSNIKTIVGDLFWTSEALDNEHSTKVLEAPIKRSMEIYLTWERVIEDTLEESLKGYLMIDAYKSTPNINFRNGCLIIWMIMILESLTIMI